MSHQLKFKSRGLSVVPILYRKKLLHIRLKDLFLQGNLSFLLDFKVPDKNIDQYHQLLKLQ